MNLLYKNHQQNRPRGGVVGTQHFTSLDKWSMNPKVHCLNKNLLMQFFVHESKKCWVAATPPPPPPVVIIGLGYSMPRNKRSGPKTSENVSDSVLTPNDCLNYMIVKYIRQNLNFLSFIKLQECV